MRRINRISVVLVTALSLVFGQNVALAQGKGKDKDKDRGEQGQGKKDGERKQHKQKHQDGKSLVSDKIKSNGKHKFHENGKFSSFVNVSNGKIAGISVQHAEKGAVPVKKYKTTRKMVEAPIGGFQRVALTLAQAEYLGTTWIGYSYYDDYGDEIIYWFPYDMILDHDTGAIEYYPAG